MILERVITSKGFPFPISSDLPPQTWKNIDLLIEGLRDVPGSKNNALSLQTSCRLQPR